MKSVSPVFIYGPGSINSNSTISELIAFIRTAFLPSDFEMVEKILLDREKKNEQEKASLAEKHCEAERVKLVMEEKLEKNEKEKEMLMKDVNEKDEMINRLKSEIAELNEWFRDFRPRVLRLEEDIALMKELHHVGDGTEENEEADPESSEEASGTESPIKKKPQHQDVIVLDDDSDNEKYEINETNPVRNTSMHGDDDDVSLPAGQLRDDDEKLEINKTNPILKSSRQKRKRSFHSDSDDHDDVSVPAGKLRDNDENPELNKTNPVLNTSLHKRKLSSRSDDHDDDDFSMPAGDKEPEINRTNPTLNTSMHKRKRSSQSDDDDDDDVSMPAGELLDDAVNAGPAIRRCDEIPEGGRLDLPAVSSDSDDEDLTDACLNNMVAGVQILNAKIEKYENNNNRVWAYDVDMKKAFENEVELCLNAVCALYRQTKSDIKPFDAQRVTKLAKILIDGDRQGKINKSSSEFKKSHPNIIDECRKLADVYYKRLFQIYKNKEDPFFPCPKI